MKYTSFHKWMTTLPLFCFVSMATCAQEQIIQDLPARFQDYQLSVFQEKVYAHIDKTFYVAGEIIWFKIYEVDGYFHKPASDAGLCYVELIGKDQKPLLQAIVDLQKGKGNGSFMLPSWIPSGNYNLRAYTNWMKNFSPENFFTQQLTIVNTLNEPVIFAPVVKDSPATKDNPTIKDALSDIQFFPEGGNLVYGLTSKVAVKATGANGKGLVCKGIILNDNNDSITSFETRRFGMTTFPLTPEKGNHYHARLLTPGRPPIALPVPYDKGYVMSLSGGKNTSINITVHSSKQSDHTPIYLFIQSHNLVNSFQVSYLSGNEAIFTINKQQLKEGVSRITIFNNNRVPVCERSYFRRPEKHLLIQASTSSSDYDTRKRIDLHLSSNILNHPPGDSAHPGSYSIVPTTADLSLSVFRIDSLQPVPEDNILTWLLLTSELKGPVESPSWYFSDTASEGVADNLMLTQGWTRFRWEEVLQNKTPYFEYLPERNGPLIQGRITDKRTGLPVPGLITNLSIPGREYDFSSTLSEPDGRVRWNIKKTYGGHEMIVQTNTPDSNYRLDLVNPFSDKFSSFQLPALSLDPTTKNSLLVRSINTQVQNSYRTDYQGHFSPLTGNDTLPFYGKADKEYNLDDYTRFITMEEVVNEFVEDVHLRRQSDKPYLRVRNKVFNTFFEDDPLLLLDGAPISDAGRILSLNPEKIKKIEVVARKFYTGPLVNDGIISFKTYEGDLGGASLDPDALVIRYAGLQRRREFYTPVYDTRLQEESPVPDVRNQLLWSPDLTTDDNGKKEVSFYTSDLSGQFIIIVQALTKDGLSGTVTGHFKVSPRP